MIAHWHCKMHIYNFSSLYKFDRFIQYVIWPIVCVNICVVAIVQRWLNYTTRNRIVLKTVPFQILLKFLQPSFLVLLLLRRRVQGFLLHSHVIRQTLWSAETERRSYEDTGPECRSWEGVSVSIQSAEPCHTATLSWRLLHERLGSCLSNTLSILLWLLSLVTIRQILTQNCQKIKHPTYFIVIT